MITLYFKVFTKLQVTGRYFLVKKFANLGWANLIKSPASLILQNKELVQSFCLPFKLKNADAMFCMRYFSKS